MTNYDLRISPWCSGPFTINTQTGTGCENMNLAMDSDNLYSCIMAGEFELFWEQYTENRDEGYFSEEFKNLVNYRKAPLNLCQYTKKISLASSKICCQKSAHQAL